MAEYIERAKAIEKINAYCELRQAIYSNDKDEFLRGLQTALKAISYNDVIPNADVQPVDKITKIIQSRLNGVQNAKINAMLSGDCNTAYKMVGAETVCIAILQDLEATKG